MKIEGKTAYELMAPRRKEYHVILSIKYAHQNVHK